jgi:HK97 gp10 family phage protein
MAFTLLGFAAKLAALRKGFDHVEHEALTEVAILYQTEAKRVLGTYDYGWAPLKEATVARKTTGDSPLLETGALRDSIEYSVTDHKASIGSDDPKAEWHEFGTSRIPPRPFIGGAYHAKEAEVKALLLKRFWQHLIHM